jgi:hypothetical protein
MRVDQPSAARSTQHATDPVTDSTVTTLAMLCLKSTFLFSGQVYFHGSEHDLHRLGEQAPSTITGIGAIFSFCYFGISN